MSLPEIVPYSADRLDEIIQVTVRAWRPVFARTANDVPRFVYDAFYPQGWEERQIRDVTQLLDDGQIICWLASLQGVLLGFVGFQRRAGRE